MPLQLKFGKFVTRVGLGAALLLSSAMVAKATDVSAFLDAQAMKWNGAVVNIEPVAAFYKARSGSGIWTDINGVTDRGRSLIELLQRANEDGLEISDYLSNLPEEWDFLDLESRVGLELCLTQSFLAFGRDLFTGRTTPSVTDPEIVIKRKKIDASTWLTFAHENGPKALLASLRPAHPQYAQLRQMLAGYRNLQRLGGWPPVSKGATLKAGMTAPRVAEMRNNLRGRGYTGIDSDNPEIFDENLKAVLEHFQKRHGLDADGVAGPATIKALSHSVDYRVQQIVTNMERWRWLPAELGSRHVFVNQASFQLHIREAGLITDQRKVIVGKEFHKTPMFSDRIRYAEFNPTWTVPGSIAGRAILPKLKKDPGYLSANDYQLYTSWKSGAPAMSPFSVNWDSVNPKKFPYRIVQQPGKKNALGQVKFMFPNKHAVYLHDTSHRELFAKSRRAFSSGCIRVHRPMEFAEKLFASSGNLNRSSIQSILNSKKTKRVDLKKPIPVHLAYFTVWVGENGVPNFYEDIYGRDKLVSNILFGKV